MDQHQFFGIARDPLGLVSEADFLAKVPKKSEEESKRLHQLLNNLRSFRFYKDREEIVDCLFERRFEPGEIVVSQGDSTNDFYLVDYGEFDVIENGTVVHRCHGAGAFGVAHLDWSYVQPATIKAVTSGKLWQLHETTLQRLIIKGQYQVRCDYKLYRGRCTPDLIRIPEPMDDYETNEIETYSQIIDSGKRSICCSIL